MNDFFQFYSKLKYFLVLDFGKYFCLYCSADTQINGWDYYELGALLSYFCVPRARGGTMPAFIFYEDFYFVKSH